MDGAPDDLYAALDLGTNNCRRIGGGSDGNWSEHATGNAIDVSAFVLEDGRRISVLKDWTSGDEKATFLREVREITENSGTCLIFDARR